MELLVSYCPHIYFQMKFGLVSFLLPSTLRRFYHYFGLYLQKINGIMVSYCPHIYYPMTFGLVGFLLPSRKFCYHYFGYTFRRLMELVVSYT